jgi:DnaJ like chaperone protein
MQTFADLLPKNENPVMASVLLLLAWVACADGKVDEAELMSLRQVAGEAFHAESLQSIIRIAQGGRVDDLQLACEVIQQIDTDRRTLVLKMALELSLDDGVLTAAESHIIRLLADIALVPPRVLDSFFEELTGRSFPAVSDMSDPAWWLRAESRTSRSRESKANETGTNLGSQDIQRIKDLATLGLDDGATRDDIATAYRRVAQVHHPDKFASLGDEAVRAAEVSFRRIQAAYERLVKS